RVAAGKKQIAETAAVREIDRAAAQRVRDRRGGEPLVRVRHPWREQREEGRTVAALEVPAVGRRQRVARLGRGDQLEIGAVGELDVLVLDAVVVRTPGLEGEPERAIVVGG